MGKHEDFNRLQSEIDELFSELCQVSRFSGLRRGFRPAVDVYRTDEPPELIIVIELAGVDPATVRVDAAERTLVIAGERLRPPVKGRAVQQLEIDYGPFQRQLVLSDDVDASDARADYEQGLLTIVLPLRTRPTGSVTVQLKGKAKRG